MLSIALLGPVEVRRDGELLSVPSGRTTEVLVRLALDAGRTVRAEQMLDELWDGAGANTLQSKVSQLRRALGDTALVAHDHGGYRLALAPERIDVAAVERLADQVAAAREAGDAEAVRDHAARALAVFRGDVLAGAGDGAWLAPHRRRWEELRLGLVEDHLAARVALGAGGEVVGELEELTARHPLREGLWASLVTALYRAGRQADALAAYARVRRRLVDDLGVDPGPGLRRLEEQILAQNAALAGLEASAAPDLRPGNLPPRAPGLVGRATETAAIRARLDEHPLVTVVGPAGVGKTRTALAVAADLEAPGGVWLVRLDGVADPAAVPSAVAATLGVPVGDLGAHLAGSPAVLLLDNAEHLLDAVAALADRLLAAAPRARVLVTSQAPLGLDVETVVPLDPLGPADAEALFAARAARLPRPVTVDPDAVAHLCRRLDGLPLAIELAAARLTTLSVPEIARRLDDRFGLLRDPASRAPARRRALGDAIAWSHDLLDDADRRGLWGLAVFAEGAPLPAAEHVLAALDVPDAVDVVGRLVARSLVTVDVTDDGVRYRLLDSVRAHARDRIAEAGLADVAGAAHAAWFAATAESQALAVRGPGQPACLVTARTERANIDAALDRCAAHDPRRGLRIAVGFGWTWVVLGDGVAGAARVRRALGAAEALGDPSDELVVDALLLTGWLEASAGDVGRAEGDLDRALALADGEDRRSTDAHRHRAFLRIQQGRPHDVRTEADAAVEGARRQGRSWETAAALLLAAYGSSMLGDTAGASTAAQEALALLEPLADPWGLVHARGILATIARAQGRLDAAADALAALAADSERQGFLGQAALHLTRLGGVEQQRGRHDAAVAVLDRALAAAQRSGDPRVAATARTTLARALHDAGDDVVALALLEQSDRWYRAAGGGEGALLTRCLLAVLIGAHDRLVGLRDEARAAGDAEAEAVVGSALPDDVVRAPGVP
ncbi:BTAD domain-containing putative transcriptional regulator [Actinomycetospora sp. C-140]